MPDHVRNPQRYTCYDLGESITVGGGDQGASAADGGEADMERVMLCPTLTLLCIWMIYTFVQASKGEGSLLCSGMPGAHNRLAAALHAMMQVHMHCKGCVEVMRDLSCAGCEISLERCRQGSC